MANNYRFDHQSHKHKKRHAFIITITSVLVIGGLVITILLLINQTTKKIKSVNGPNVLVGQISANPGIQNAVVNEPTYSFNLPQFWKQTSSVSSAVQNS